jgi:hypothetical protein
VGSEFRTREASVNADERILAKGAFLIVVLPFCLFMTYMMYDIHRAESRKHGPTIGREEVMTAAQIARQVRYTAEVRKRWERARGQDNADELKRAERELERMCEAAIRGEKQTTPALFAVDDNQPPD